MLRTLKPLLIAAVVLATLPVSASTAANFTSQSYPDTWTGETWTGETLETEAGRVECNGHFEGSLSAASSTLTLVPKYTNCQAFGFLTAEVNFTGCDYLWHVTFGSSDLYSGTIDIVCPSEKSIDVTASTCAFSIPAQTGLKSISFSNWTAGGDFEATTNASELKYTVTKDGFGCPFGGTGEKVGGTYRNSLLTMSSVFLRNIDIG